MTQFQAAFERLEQFIKQHRQLANIPGVAVALTNCSELLHLTTDGYADLSAQTPITPDTLFEIGSIGKSFTCIALLQQYEAGKLDLHAPVKEYLPWFQVQSTYEPITVHHLMSHTAGIIGTYSKIPDSRYEVWALRNTEAAYPPSKHFHYSNVGYKALGFLLEDLLGQPYPHIIQSHILDPLRMKATVAAITPQTRTRAAVGYQSIYDNRPFHINYPLVPAPWVEYGTGVGSIASCAMDMAIYLRMLLNHGQGDGIRLLSEDSFNLMTQRVIGKAWHESLFYGYGLIVYEVDGHTHIAHSGETTGFNALIIADLNEGLGAVVLMNGSGVPAYITEFAMKLLRAALRNQELPPVPTPPDSTLVNNADEYAGVYQADKQQLVLISQDQKLLLQYAGETIPLKRRGKDTFCVEHPDFALFFLTFGWEGKRVVEAFHGADWYVNQHYTGTLSFEYPEEWRAYAGHYRSHNPWFNNFRIVLRKGALVLLYPMGSEKVLIPLRDCTFCVGDVNCSPERLRFDTVVAGKALRANFSGCDYYRTPMS
ncbi:serine hydrolase domain-containing protein [Scytonema sp. PCC 10023]|uniref:serine hydrolase domain-containing protein n=1 Tax=Scytonema sp. PCC 10023 TaxID=1680591 RepID=UPI0039C669D9